jgi:hypothetical protein
MRCDGAEDVGLGMEIHPVLRTSLSGKAARENRPAHQAPGKFSIKANV